MALSVTITPNNPSLFAREIIRFTATPSGGTPDSYQWNVDGSNVSGANQSTYILDNNVIGTRTIKCYAIIVDPEEIAMSETETVTAYSEYPFISTIKTNLDTIRKAVE